MFGMATSFRTFKAQTCVYEVEPSDHNVLTKNKLTFDMVIPMDWVGDFRRMWGGSCNNTDCTCEENTSGNTSGNTSQQQQYYPSNGDIMLFALNNSDYKIDETFPRGENNEFVERYRRDILKPFYNDNVDVANSWAVNIESIVTTLEPYKYVNPQQNPFINYSVNLSKIQSNLEYVPNVNKLDKIWYSPFACRGTDVLSKLINNINVGEVLDLLWNYFYLDFDCSEQHVFDPYNVLKMDDELVFPVHILSIWGYSDHLSLLSYEDDVLYDYHVNIRFKQNVVPETLTPELKPISKPIVGEPDGES